MRRAVGLAMVVDGVLQAMGVAELLPSLLDRSFRDQALVAAHVIVGAGLVFLGMHRAGSKAPAVVLVVAFALALVETTWFNWTGTVLRALYTAAALYVVTRKTTLPTT